jgi:hypothetical protein
LFLLVSLFVCFESQEQFFSYLVTVTIAGDRAANLYLCLAFTASSSEGFFMCHSYCNTGPLSANLDLCSVFTAFSSKGSFKCHTYCNMGPPFLRSYPKDSWFYLLNAVFMAKEQSLSILNVLVLTRPARAGLELTTYCLLSESTTTKLRQQSNKLSFFRNIYKPNQRPP